jgi:hypothetical protein
VARLGWKAPEAEILAPCIQFGYLLNRLFSINHLALSQDSKGGNSTNWAVCKLGVGFAREHARTARPLQVLFFEFSQLRPPEDFHNVVGN